MMNFADLILCLFTGFAIPLALCGFVAEGVGLYVGNGASPRGSRLLAYWTSAMICGPGLFATRLLAGFRSGEESVGEQVTGWVAAAGWAVLYGYVVLGSVKLAFGLAS